VQAEGSPLVLVLVLVLVLLEAEPPVPSSSVSSSHEKPATRLAEASNATIFLFMRILLSQMRNAD